MPAPVQAPAARRRCSRWATSPNYNGARRATRWRGSATRRRLPPISPEMSALVPLELRAPAACQSRRDDPGRDPGLARVFGVAGHARKRRRAPRPPRRAAFRLPTSVPARRLQCIEAAGFAAVPFHLGDPHRHWRDQGRAIEGVAAGLRDLHERHGHIQEIIIQNFRALPETCMALALEPDRADHLRTIAVARLIFGPR